MIDVIIPHINKPELLEKCLKLYAETCDKSLTRVLVIDNGSDEPLKNDIYGDIIRFEDNLGMIQSLEVAKQHSTAEILIYTHSDMFYYEKGWDHKVMEAFRKDEKLGLLGTVGGMEASPDGGRGSMYCSFRNGHLHGTQTPEGVHYVALLDGCSLMFRRTALDSFEIDKTFFPHHFYDKDWCLEVLTRGWRVGVIAMDCEHLGGQITIGGQKYQGWATDYLKKHNIQTKETGDNYFYQQNEKRYMEKWRSLLPIMVAKDGSYKTKKELYAGF